MNTDLNKNLSWKILQSWQASDLFNNTNNDKPIIDWNNANILRNGIGFNQDSYWQISGSFELDTKHMSIYAWMYTYETDQKSLLLNANYKVNYLWD